VFGAELKVGVIFLLGLIILGLIVWFLLGYGPTRDRYPICAIFDQAPLQRGDEVQVAGVVVGEVTAVRLTRDNRARVTMRVDRQVRLHQNDVITIGTGTLLGESYVEIIPAKPPHQGRVVPAGTCLQGQTKPELEDLVIASEQLVKNLETTVTALNAILSDPQLLSALRAGMANFREVTAEAKRLTQALNAITAENREQVGAITANLADTTAEVRDLAADLAQGFREADVPATVAGAAENVRTAAARLDQVAADLQRISSDPALRENTLKVVENVRAASDRLTPIADNLERSSQNIEAASAQAKEAAESANRFIQRYTGGKEGKGPKLSFLPEVAPQVDVQYLGRDSHWWTEANLDLTWTDRLFRLGVADIGESDRLNLQLGRAGRHTYRLGVVQSKAGVGMDWPWLGGTWSLDLFDPNDPRANLISAWPLADDFSLTAGVREAGQHPTAAVGVRWRR